MFIVKTDMEMGGKMKKPSDAELIHLKEQIATLNENLAINKEMLKDMMSGGQEGQTL
jgi:hypothetical protein